MVLGWGRFQRKAVETIIRHFSCGINFCQKLWQLWADSQYMAWTDRPLLVLHYMAKKKKVQYVCWVIKEEIQMTVTVLNSYCFWSVETYSLKCVLHHVWWRQKGNLHAWYVLLYTSLHLNNMAACMAVVICCDVTW